MRDWLRKRRNISIWVAMRHQSGSSCVIKLQLQYASSFLLERSLLFSSALWIPGRFLLIWWNVTAHQKVRISDTMCWGERKRRYSLCQCATPDQQEHLTAPQVSCPRAHGNLWQNGKLVLSLVKARKLLYPQNCRILLLLQVELGGIKEGMVPHGCRIVYFLQHFSTSYFLHVREYFKLESIGLLDLSKFVSKNGCSEKFWPQNCLKI